MTEIAKVHEIPPCDFCDDSVPAAYDARMKVGSWAYLCSDHFAEWGIGLGTGLGQRLVLDTDA